eukprot:4941644-Prymnesium_polylepis.1
MASEAEEEVVAASGGRMNGSFMNTLRGMWGVKRVGTHSTREALPFDVTQYRISKRGLGNATQTLRTARPPLVVSAVRPAAYTSSGAWWYPAAPHGRMDVPVCVCVTGRRDEARGRGT